MGWRNQISSGGKLKCEGTVCETVLPSQILLRTSSFWRLFKSKEKFFGIVVSAQFRWWKHAALPGTSPFGSLGSQLGTSLRILSGSCISSQGTSSSLPVTGIYMVEERICVSGAALLGTHVTFVWGESEEAHSPICSLALGFVPLPSTFL